MHPHLTPSADLASEEFTHQTHGFTPIWVRRINASLYWVLLVISIVGNFILSVAFVPFFLVLEGLALYSALFMIGLCFGALFSGILHSIDNLRTGQHIIASIFIPALALINVGIFAVLSNKLIGILALTTPPHNPVLIGAIYVLGYVLPEAIMHYLGKD